VAILNLLESHGVKIENEAALRLLDDAGAMVDQAAKTVRFPGYLVEEAIRKAPKTVRLCARDKGNDFVLEGKKAYFGPSTGHTIITDPKTGERRQPRYEDAVTTVKVCDALENQDYVMGIFTPTEAPKSVHGLYEAEATMTNTTKHTVLCSYHGKEVTRKLVEVAALIAGGEEELMKRPIASLYDEPTSPLLFGKDYVDALIEWTKARLPIIWAPCPISGATGPVTLAGNIVQGMAESLAGNVIVQLINPGTPFICGFVPIAMDMRTGLGAYGSPENWIMGVAEAQIAHYMELPLWGTGGCTDSKVLDEQAVAEASLTLQTAALSGQNLIHDVGLIESGLSFSPELLVICDEVIAMLKRFMMGTEVNDGTLALEEIREAKHGGAFINLKHTRDHFKEEHWIPELMDRTFSFTTWEKNRKTLLKRVREKIDTMLSEHEIEPVPKDVKEKIEEIKKSLA